MAKYIVLRLLSFSALSLVFAGCGGTPTGSQASYRVYVTNERSGDLSVIDGKTHKVVATVPLGKRPRGIHASPDGQTIYVALSGSPIAGPGVDETKLPPADKKADAIGVFDVRENKLLKLIPAGSDPEEFDLSKDGKLLFCSNEDVGLTSIVDIESGKVLAEVPVGPEPEGVTTSPDGSLVYVTSEQSGTVTVIDAMHHKAIKTIPVGNRPRDVAFFPDGSKAYVTRENDGVISLIDVLKHQTVQTVDLGPPGEVRPMAVILSSDATKAYVSAGRGKRVFVVDTATNMPTASVEVGERPWGIALSPDGRFLYTANGPSNDVSVVDLTSNTVIKKIGAGTGPWGVITLAERP